MRTESEYEPSQKEVDEAVESARRQMEEYCREHGIYWDEGEEKPDAERLAEAEKDGWEELETVTNASRISISGENTPRNYEYKILGFGNTFKVLRRKKTGLEK